MISELQLGIEPAQQKSRGIVLPEANFGVPSPVEAERMARRRFQAPQPFREGHFWWLMHWVDEFAEGKRIRKRKRTKLAPVSIPEREVKKIAAEILRPLNQGLVTVGSAMSFADYVNYTYIPVVLPTYASSTHERYKGVVNNYLVPQFGSIPLRSMTTLALQTYFSQAASNENLKRLSHESVDKIRDVLSSVLESARKYKLLSENPAENVQLLPDRKGKRRHKPFLTPQQFTTLISLMAEPYASMIYVAIYTGLRVSELIGLRWEDVHESAITIDERCCRGDWGQPKSDASNATIPVNKCVIERIHNLKDMTVEVPAGRATRKYRLVKSSQPTDLVFQSVKTGAAMRDNNILVRHIKPAARKLGIEWANWLVLRRSHDNWLRMAGADLKDRQAQMRHAHPQTTADVYDQFFPENQVRAVEKLSKLMEMVQ